MIGEIIKILPVKRSRNEGDCYLRVEFKMEDGSWKKTDLVPGFRNYQRWKKLLRVGNVLFNLKILDDQTIDADGFPRLLEGEKVRKWRKLNLKEMSELGIFG